MQEPLDVPLAPDLVPWGSLLRAPRLKLVLVYTLPPPKAKCARDLCALLSQTQLSRRCEVSLATEQLHRAGVLLGQLPWENRAGAALSNKWAGLALGRGGGRAAAVQLFQHQIPPKFQPDYLKEV